MVDTVLYFEGDRGHPYRILRAVKNRFGPPTRSACSRWCGRPARGRQPVGAVPRRPRQRAPGAAVFAGVEGTRPLLVEIQALVAPSALGTPRRAVVGWDSNRLSMLLAVLERALRHVVRRPRRLSERRRRPEDHRAGRRSRRRRRPCCRHFRVLPCRATPSISARCPCRAPSAPRRIMTARLKEAQKLGFASAVVPESGRGWIPPA